MLSEFLDRMRRGPSDVVGLDIGSTSVKAVRMHKGTGSPTVTAVAALPLPESLEGAEVQGAVRDFSLPASLKARHACLAMSGPDAIIKLLSLPGHFDERAEERVIESMGLDDPATFRIAYKLIIEGHGRSESRVLAVAFPETSAAVGPSLFAVGHPVPHSLEVSGLAGMAAFLRGPGAGFAGGAVGAIDFGAHTSTFALFNRNLLALVRRFAFGTEDLLDKVQSTLGVDRETAQGIVMDGSFDISQSVNEIIEPLVKQLIVSRDFVERRENCHVETLYAAGGLALSHDVLSEIRAAMEVDVERWNPFEGLTVAKEAIPENLEGQEWQFAAAIGCCLGTFEET